MPSAIAIPIRQEIVRLRQQGQSYGAIGAALNLSEHSVRQIWRRFQQQGEPGLAPTYERCGHRGVKSERLIWRAAVYLKRWHPVWVVGSFGFICNSDGKSFTSPVNGRCNGGFERLA